MEALSGQLHRPRGELVEGSPREVAFQHRRAMTNSLVTRSDTRRVAVVAIQNPPVNALSTRVVNELHALLGAAIADNDVDAVVLIGSGRTFVAGADITEFVKTGTGPLL